MFAALAGLIFTGISWSLYGVILGAAPKRGVSVSAVLVTSQLIAISGGLILLGCGFQAPAVSCSGQKFWITFATYMAQGIINYLMLEVTSKAMQLGPNGIIWTITQSGLLFTFLFGVLAKGESAGALRLIGITILIVSLVILGLAQDNTTPEGRSRRWVPVAFLGFMLCGIHQTLATLPSYDPEVRDGINTVVRMTITAGGMGTGALLWGLWSERGQWFRKFAASCRLPFFWGSAAVIVTVSLFIAFLCYLPSMDRLTQLGLGSASYPVLVSSCMIGFALYSRVVLKEKFSLLQFTGLVLCILGVCGVCLK